MRVVATIVRCKAQGSLITNQATFLAQVGRYSKIFKFPFARKFWSARCGAYVAHIRANLHSLLKTSRTRGWYLTVIFRGRAGYELIYITNDAVGRVGYYQLISGKSEKNNCFNKISSNSLDFFGCNLLKSWHFLYRRRREKNFSDLQNFSTRNSPSVFPNLVKLNDNGSYHGLREPIRKLEIIILS